MKIETKKLKNGKAMILEIHSGRSLNNDEIEELNEAIYYEEQ